MGIPRMFSHLQSLAVPKTLGCKTDGCTEHPFGPTIIIDGPSLAFYVNYRILAHRSPSTNPIDAVPSYNELGKATLAFLDEFQQHGLTIEAIFFDGFLPLDKSSIRKARLEASFNQLLTFHSTFSDGFHVSRCASNQPLITAAQLLDPLRSAPSSLKGTPVPAFLVPAVQETLQDSKYASVTAVVPDEADPFCAGTACKSGGIILTGDSDLLVYDLGKQGAVSFFSQLEQLKDDESPRKCDVLRASISHPLEIAQRLGLTDLKRFSFELLRDASLSLTEIVRRAKQSVSEPLPQDASKQKTFQEFCRDYEPKAFDFMTEAGGKAHLHENTPKIQLLDPRISELIFSSSSPPSIYLPFLIEDPSRTAAWNISRDLRRFAYSCLKSKTSNFPPEAICEFRRQGQRIESEIMRTFSAQKLQFYAEELATALETFRSTFGEFSTVVVWRTFALSETLRRYAESQKKRPPRSALAYSIFGQQDKKISWLDLHLTAHIEAVLYSFRILKQILHYHSGTLSTSQNPESQPTSLSSSPSPPPPPPSSSSSQPQIFSHLTTILNTLPPLNQLMPSRLEQVKPQPNLDIDRLLNLLASHLHPPAATDITAENSTSRSEDFFSPADDGFQTVPKKQRHQHQRNQSKQQTESKRRVRSHEASRNLGTNNMFNALLQD